MAKGLEISLLGELRVFVDGAEARLPASRKARALLAYLVATGRPHRRERLCELFWDLPHDPKASLRWALSKLRAVVDEPGRPRIVADRERVAFDLSGVAVDLHEAQRFRRRREAPGGPERLEALARRLERTPFDGLDGAGDDRFDAWLQGEREDARTARIVALRLLASHSGLAAGEAEKWRRLWRAEDPEGEAAAPRPGAAEALAPPQALKSQRIGYCAARDGVKIAYAVVGEGPPLLKAANWLNHLELDWSSPIWGRSFAALAAARTFIRYDERGCGLSDWEVDDLGFDAFVADLEAVADRLELERFPLLGVSQGAAVSIEYAARHPERVSGLILLGGYAAGWRRLMGPEEQARREAVIRLTEVGWGADNPAYRHIFSQTFMPDAPAEALAWFDDFQRHTASPKNAARFQQAFGEIDVRPRLAEVRAPTLVLHSAQDQRIPIEQGRMLAEGIPGARFLPLESRNHILVDDEPAWRTCVDAIADFLAVNGI